ncbi:MAG: hypothetical protein OEQ28_10015, partial [Acidobacteriota bacterium]|nr:hypothetical protein [Acidobacteriota bacterium]
MSNQQEDKDVLDEEIVEGEPEVIGFEDKRRFDDSGERVEVKVEDAEAADPPKPAEVVRLEKQ